jgi:hypothetical protein
VSAVRVEPTFSVPEIATTAVGATGSALALDNPDTPIARVRKPVIKTLES